MVKIPSILMMLGSDSPQLLKGLHLICVYAPLDAIQYVVGLCNLSHVSIVHVITILMALETSSDKQINICELG